jgi:site-specific DNA-cytosine methylase
MDYMVRSTNGKYSDRWSYLQKPAENDKALCITANIHKGVPYNICAEPVNTTKDGKTNALTTAQKDNNVCEPVPISPKELTDREIDYMFRVPERTDYGYIQRSTDDKAKCITANISKGVPYNCMFDRVYPDRQPCYAMPCEWDEDGNPIKAVSCADGKTYTVYEVKDGSITIKGKQYPIKLVDGYYIIRKLTVSECKRLQTVPEWYEFPVSDSQAYKQLGNGWTISVISHLLTACLKPARDEDELYCDTEGNYRFF